MTQKGRVWATTFVPDAGHIATATEKTTLAWRWRAGDLIAGACTHLTCNLTRAEWKWYIADEPYRPTYPNLSVADD